MGILTGFYFGILLIFILEFGLSSEYDALTLLEKYAYNRYLYSSIPRPFETINPKQIGKNRLVGISTKETQIRHHGTYEHYKKVTFQLKINNVQHKIRLTRNEALLSHGIKVKQFLKENKQVVSETVEHCYYHGYVKKDPWSSVAVSTCNGIRGVINFHNETYIIHPLYGGDEGTDHPHLIYKATPSHTETCGNNKGQWIPFQQLHEGEFIRRMKLMKAQQEAHQISREEKVMKLALVVDNDLFQKLNLPEENVVQYIIQTANMVDLYYKDLNIRTPLVYVECWSSGNKINVQPKLRRLLQDFLAYKMENLIDVKHHTAHLITGIELEDKSVGMAIPDSVCTDRAISISKSPKLLEPQQLATILSHMIGHNIGIKHDEDGPCTCEDEFGCIMSADVLERTGLHSRLFSSCSLSDLDVALSIDVASCLRKKSEPTFTQKCGNMHVERGEECDCGSSEEACEIIDPCCDAKTCLLKSWTQCRTGACCHNCTFKSDHHVCRQPSTECDVPEFCTGNSGECPENNYIADGHPCLNDTGYCMGGICPTLDQQCQHIWGQNASGADLQCFDQFNPTGNFNGHCGLDQRTGSFAKCLPEDVQCGLLHCEGGSTSPSYRSAGSDRAYSETLMSINGVKYGCKVIHGPALMELPYHGLVEEGTKCADGKICMKKQCVDISVLSPLNCPGTDKDIICSGNGVCTKSGTCFCNQGWAGLDCTTKVKVTTTTVAMTTTTTTVTTVITSASTAQEIRVVPILTDDITSKAANDSSIAAVVKADGDGLSSMWLIIILVSVVGGVVMVLALTLLCYRRKSPVKFSSGKRGLFGWRKKKGDHSVETGSKLIKFGSMPTYKNQKGFKKKKKGKKGRSTSEEESDIGELPPPPVIISDPDSARPERGILKNGLKQLDDRRSSESNTGGSDVNYDQESVERYTYDEDDDDDDIEAEEIQEILSRKFEPEQSVEALDQFTDNGSFDFILPTPNFSGFMGNNRSPSPTHRLLGYDVGTSMNSPQRPFLWKSNPSSPPKRKIVRMKNLDELIQQIDRQTIDLSPSPDELPMQISPSTSEDIRSSSTEDRHYQNNHTPQSPLSFTSGSTRDTFRPFLGSQWTNYMLKRNELDNGIGLSLSEAESPFNQINIPPPMSPLNIRNIFNYAQTTLGRDSNDTPLGSQTGECSSTNGTANSRGFDKSSGYGSEHDHERFSVEDVSRNQSRSGSTSPPSYSAVIRTGPNQIKLVPAKKLQETGIGDSDLQRLLQGLPRIDAGTFERSPLHKNEPKYDAYNFESLPPGVMPNACPLSEQDADNCGSTPCIDRSLEEIPGALEKSKSKKRNSLTKQKRPLSLGNVQKENSPGRDVYDTESKRYSALDDMSGVREVIS